MNRADINKLDKLWGSIVKSTQRYVCEMCKITGRMEAAHVVGRRHRTTRWGTMLRGKFDFCGHCLCHRCHQQYDEHGPLESRIISEVIGQVRKEEIQFIAKTTIAKNQDYDEIKDFLNVYWEKLQETPRSI